MAALSALQWLWLQNNPPIKLVKRGFGLSFFYQQKSIIASVNYFLFVL